MCKQEIKKKEKAVRKNLGLGNTKSFPFFLDLDDIYLCNIDLVSNLFLFIF